MCRRLMILMCGYGIKYVAWFAEDLKLFALRALMSVVRTMYSKVVQKTD